MNKLFKAFVVLLFVFALTACTSNNVTTVKLDVSEKNVELKVEETYEIAPQITGASIDLVEYVVADPTILSIDGAKVTALKVGATTITLKVKGYDVTEEITVTVTEKEVEVKEFTLTFKDYDGTVLKEEKIEEGKAATAPENPTREGYTFTGWDTDFSKVEQDLEVTAQYEEIKPEVFTVTFKDYDGTVLSEVTVEKGQAATAPENPTREGYDFTGWDKDFSKVEANLEVIAQYKEKEIDYSKIESLEVELVCEDDNIYFDSVVSFNIKAYPEGMSNEVTYRVKSGANYVSIDEDLNVTFKGTKEVVIEFASAHNKKVKSSVTLSCLSYINPEKYLSSLNYDNAILKKAYCTGFENNGASSYWFYLVGAVNLLYFDPIEITEMWLSETAPNYDGKTMDRIRYITVHDTAAASPTSTAKANGGWCTNPTNDGSSWHYTLGNDGIFQHLKNNQVAWHAGDGTTTKLTFTNTHIKATSEEPAKVTVSSDGYWELNGVKSDIKAPLAGGRIATNADLPYTGINNYVGTDGNYWIGNTWWSSTYQTVSNRGGNLNSIGIETAINKGSNLYLTWAMLAKFVGGKLCVETGLAPKDVKQHNTFSGKNCPQTMREAGMWEMFMERVTAEYKLGKYFKGWTMKLEIDSPYVGADGLITKLPDVETTVEYKIILSKGDLSYEKVFKTVIPARPADFDDPLAI